MFEALSSLCARCAIGNLVSPLRATRRTPSQARARLTASETGRTGEESMMIQSKCGAASRISSPKRGLPEIGRLIAAITARNKGQVLRDRGSSRGHPLKRLRPLHNLNQGRLAGKIVRQAGMRLAAKKFMEGVTPHVSVNQEHLAVLVAREAHGQIGRDEALALLRHAAGYHDALERADVAQLEDSGAEASKLLYRRSALEQRRQVLQRQRPGADRNLAEIER